MPTKLYWHPWIYIPSDGPVRENGYEFLSGLSLKIGSPENEVVNHQITIEKIKRLGKRACPVHYKVIF